MGAAALWVSCVSAVSAFWCPLLCSSDDRSVTSVSRDSDPKSLGKQRIAACLDEVRYWSVGSCLSVVSTLATS